MGKGIKVNIDLANYTDEFLYFLDINSFEH